MFSTGTITLVTSSIRAPMNYLSFNQNEIKKEDPVEMKKKSFFYIHESCYIFG